MADTPINSEEAFILLVRYAKLKGFDVFKTDVAKAACIPPSTAHVKLGSAKRKVDGGTGENGNKSVGTSPAAKKRRASLIEGDEDVGGQGRGKGDSKRAKVKQNGSDVTGERHPGISAEKNKIPPDDSCKGGTKVKLEDVEA